MIRTKKLSTARERMNIGFNYLRCGRLKNAIQKFELALRAGDGSNLERDVAAWWMVNIAKYRREWKKRRFGNAHLFLYDEENNGKAWSDVEIATVLLTPNTPKLNDYLIKFLGRSPEAVRFQRRYAQGHLLTSWRSEDGKRYTRYTQNYHVRNKLGV